MSTGEPAPRRGRAGRLLRLARWAGAAAAIAVAVTVGAVLSTWSAIGPPPLERARILSSVVLDRHDRLLRAFTTDDGRWRLPVAVKDVDPRYIAMLIAYEDRHYKTHHGVDPGGLARAGLQLVTRGRIVSGGSTLTMQVARLLDGVHERSAAGKFRQIVRALQLERKLTKTEILHLYLLLAPFGGNLEGVRAASLAYFGKEPKRLSIGEAALLVALPQAPESRRPDRFAAAARIARSKVLARAVSRGVISADEARRARREPIPTRKFAVPMLAPHLSVSEVGTDRIGQVLRLTLDGRMQASLEQAAAAHVQSLGGRLSAALVVVENASGEVLAYVGSADYLDDTRFGAIDMTRAVRSPGSTLKPVIYGLAFEAGMAHPETLIEDRPARFGTYTPKNFDRGWHGSVTVREALAQSLNIPAVKVLNAVGPARLMARFQQVGLQPELPDGAEPSLAIALGGIGVKLTDLASLYVALARGGTPAPLTWRRGVMAAAAQVRARGETKAASAHLLSPVAAWYVADILRNAPPPVNFKPGSIAYKTGTSYGLRDAWAVGFDGRYTVAVWVGRPDAASTPGLNGRASAAPLLFDAFQRIGARRVPLLAAPSGVLRVSGSELPPPLKRFRDGEDPHPESGFIEAPVQIAFPPDRSEIEVEPEDGGAITVKAEGGTLPLTWLIDGKPAAAPSPRREVELAVPEQGFVRLTVIDAKGRTDRVSVRVR
ncbi:MAG: penicillin-binding protein 1C [Hyphomicrobiaceae bacterium]